MILGLLDFESEGSTAYLGVLVEASSGLAIPLFFLCMRTGQGTGTQPAP
jgi:hypothetical protein